MIDREAAIEIARKRAAEKGWGFAEPLDVHTRYAWFGNRILRFTIWTNFGIRGTKARFVINAATGEIEQEGYIPR